MLSLRYVFFLILIKLHFVVQWRSCSVIVRVSNNYEPIIFALMKGSNNVLCIRKTHLNWRLEVLLTWRKLKTETETCKCYDIMFAFHLKLMFLYFTTWIINFSSTIGQLMKTTWILVHPFLQRLTDEMKMQTCKFLCVWANHLHSSFCMVFLHWCYCLSLSSLSLYVI